MFIVISRRTVYSFWRVIEFTRGLVLVLENGLCL